MEASFLLGLCRYYETDFDAAVHAVPDWLRQRFR